jgi:hypothetical protein
MVPDNPKIGVTRANWYEPVLDRTYLDLATHYGMVILPTRTRKPSDQAKVEVGVLGDRALDSGTAARPPFLLAWRIESGDRRTDRRSQRAPDATFGRQPPEICSSSSTAQR